MKAPDLRGDILVYLRAVVARSRDLGRGVALSRVATERAADEIQRLRAEVARLTRKAAALPEAPCPHAADHDPDGGAECVCGAQARGDLFGGFGSNDPEAP